MNTSKHFTHHASIEFPWLDKFHSESRLFTGKGYHWIKRISDISIVLITAIGWLPLGIFIALIIKLESPQDPVVFKQWRTGKGGKRFIMFKFRTMVKDAEVLKQDLVEVNDDGELSGPLKLENDPRVTFVGKFLRKLSLDEIPQVFNVLKGDMSLVGPRPTSWGLKSYELWHTERLDILPGVTGLWQICARGDEDFNDWLRWDILYMKKRSLMFDFEILIRTVMAVLKKRGAR